MSIFLIFSLKWLTQDSFTRIVLRTLIFFVGWQWKTWGFQNFFNLFLKSWDWIKLSLDFRRIEKIDRNYYTSVSELHKKEENEKNCCFGIRGVTNFQERCSSISMILLLISYGKNRYPTVPSFHFKTDFLHSAHFQQNKNATDYVCVCGGSNKLENISRKFHSLYVTCACA